jgi:hypothetical protein
LISHNWKDLLLLHNAWQRWLAEYVPGQLPRHGGIVVIPHASGGRWLAPHAAAEIDAFLRSHAQVSNELWRWRPAAGWTRY